MRLVKLLAYGALGYLLYEFFNGLVYGSSHANKSNDSSAGSRDLHRALNEDQGRSAITGGGHGRVLRSEDADGASSPHAVGRGVVHR